MSADFVAGVHQQLADLAELGKARAADHAERESPTWNDRALGYFREFAARGEPFTTEDVRERADKDGLPLPPDKRAWGAVASRAVRLGIIDSVGPIRAKNAETHSGWRTLWIGR